MSLIRVRYAPSPTGHLHLGSLRTALFNWLFARHNNGAFLLRIEDTDFERSKLEYTKSILETLDWVDIRADEPIVVQSEQIALHKKVINEMLQNGTAYKCYCTPEELACRLGSGAATEGYVKYDRKCRNIDQNLNKPFAVRFRLPDDIESISFDDLIRGQITFDIDQFDDFIIARSDGTPMYNFVVVVDDVNMNISHILRGEDHITNTPKQILLYRANNYKIPLFGHFPNILGPDGNKLSKRDAATGVLDYKHSGFLAQALCNYLVRLGWSHGDQEIFTKEELIKFFSLDHVGRKGAIFDIKKLEWTNSVYLKGHSAEQLACFIEKDIDPLFRTYFEEWQDKVFMEAINLYKERVKTLVELISELRSLYERPGHFEEFELIPWLNEETENNMASLERLLSGCENFTAEELSKIIKAFCSEKNVGLPQIAKPLRVALTGKSSSPGVFELLALLGKTESIIRINHFRHILSKGEVKKH